MLTSESAVRLLEHISRKFNSTSDTVQYDNTATINNKNKSVTSSKPNSCKWWGLTHSTYPRSVWVGPGAGEVSGIGHGVNVSAVRATEEHDFDTCTDGKPGVVHWPCFTRGGEGNVMFCISLGSRQRRFLPMVTLVPCWYACRATQL